MQGRGEHEDMPDNQDRVAAGVGGMVGLRRVVARWGRRGIIGVGRRPSVIPFDLGAHFRVAVKIVDDRGVESLKVIGVQ